MKLYYSPSSPYVRKVMVVAHRAALVDSIELVSAATSPLEVDPVLSHINPIGKIPTLVVDGVNLFDSPVICEFLDSHAGAGLFPSSGSRRWAALTQQALGDGLLDAALLIRYELTVRSAELQFESWKQGQLGKITRTLDAMEAQVDALEDTIGAITFGCALGYLDFRFTSLDWRGPRKALANWFEDYDARPAMVATRPPAAN